MDYFTTVCNICSIHQMLLICLLAVPLRTEVLSLHVSPCSLSIIVSPLLPESLGNQLVPEPLVNPTWKYNIIIVLFLKEELASKEAILLLDMDKQCTQWLFLLSDKKETRQADESECMLLTLMDLGFFIIKMAL